MSEMVEHVARALFDLAVSDAVCDQEDWSALKVDFIERGRIAIAAMRKPTEAMLQHFWSTGLDAHGDGVEPARELWGNMIDEALKS